MCHLYYPCFFFFVERILLKYLLVSFPFIEPPNILCLFTSYNRTSFYSLKLVSIRHSRTRFRKIVSLAMIYFYEQAVSCYNKRCCCQTPVWGIWCRSVLTWEDTLKLPLSLGDTLLPHLPWCLLQNVWYSADLSLQSGLWFQGGRQGRGRPYFIFHTCHSHQLFYTNLGRHRNNLSDLSPETPANCCSNMINYQKQWLRYYQCLHLHYTNGHNMFLSPYSTQLLYIYIQHTDPRYIHI